ncbi:cell cycle checkpoint protein RAD17-like isoform X2 [Paramacrobiotus metropolitanus]|uniref:cell cycle checkpoint protein RAD17-like isoform X2 n=1 Tax=Paramacrobiotus metropolitanus TaxID=2943436 RepID=UPI0024463E2F|nr:cell cycle checkpoint protein RAD17-like isoform X2 [Paramacrobiotus metropolitanus]
MKETASASLKDLCVRNPKIEEIAAWITNMANPTTSRILLMTGPPGSGKSTSVRLIAQELSTKIVEWESPVVQYIPDGDNAFYESYESLFSNFLLRSSRYNQQSVVDTPGMDSRKDARVIVVEDLPNFCFRDPTKLHGVLRNFVSCSCTGLVIVLTENNAENQQLWRLFPPSLISELNITHIRINPVVKTSMKRILTQILKAEYSQSTVISPDTLEDVIDSSNGDIRGAVSALQFAVEGRRSERGGKKQKTETIHGKGFSNRDTSLLLFRAVGRVFYVKRNTNEVPVVNGLPASAHDQRRFPLTYIPEEIAERCPTSTDNLLSFINGNYLYFLPHLSDAVSGAERFSVADLIDSAWTSREKVRDCATSVVIRGLMHLNRIGGVEKGSARFKAMEKPLLPQVERKAEGRRVAGYDLAYSMNTGINLSTLFTEYLPFLGKIGSYPPLPDTRKYMQEMCFFSHGSLLRETVKENEWISPTPTIENVGPVTVTRENSIQILTDELQGIDFSTWTEDFSQDDTEQTKPAMNFSSQNSGKAGELISVIEDFSDDDRW